jgi:metal-dependent amidase/aminoacylase/carboxypeptidase family protein
MLLVAARVLAGRRADFRGAVKLLFQPAEEFGGGAKEMVKDGALEGVDEVRGAGFGFQGVQLLCG